MKRDRLVWFVLLGPLLLLGPVVLAGDAFFYGTLSLQFHPWRAEALRQLLGGDLPLWNPLSGMGAPLLANYQSALLYPPTWFLLALGALGGNPLMAWGMGIVLIGHLVVAGWGMVRLMRALGFGALAGTVSGLAFGLSGYLAARSHFMSINAAAAWLPWVLLWTYRLVIGARDGRAALGLSAVLALLLLSGHAQTAWYTLLLAAAWLLFWVLHNRAAHSHKAKAGDGEGDGEGESERSLWRPIILFAGALLLAVCVAAAQLLPTLELLAESQRAGGAAEEFALTYSFWPWRFLGLFFPGMFGSPAFGDYWGFANYWEDAVYVGLLPILLAGRAIFRGSAEASRRPLVFFLTAVTSISFLLALGRNTPVFPFLYRHVPTFDLFQAPTRITLLAVFSLALLAGIGAQDWAGRMSSYARSRAGRGIAAALALVLAGAATLIALPAIEPSFGRSILIAGSVGTAAGLLGLARRRDVRWQALVAGLVLFDLLAAGWGLNPGIDLDFYADQPETAGRIKERLSGGRLFLPEEDEYGLTFDVYFRFDTFAADRTGLRASLLPNLNLLEGLASANNFDPLLAAGYARWLETLAAGTPSLRARMLSEMGVSLIGNRDGRVVRYEPADALPRFRWHPCAVPADGQDHALEVVVNSDEALGGSLVIETPGRETGPICEEGPGTTAVSFVELLEERAGRLRIRTAAATPGWLLIRDMYYPGWRAEVDGEPVQVLRANSVFRALPLEGGEHVVQLRYQPASFRIGVAFSLIGLAALILLFRRYGFRAVEA